MCTARKGGEKIGDLEVEVMRGWVTVKIGPVEEVGVHVEEKGAQCVDEEGNWEGDRRDEEEEEE